MFDRAATAFIKPALDVAAATLVRSGVRADAVTLIGFVIGIFAAASIVLQHPGLGLALILASRLMDGLDGAVARLTTATDRGAFLDITLDFLFYASIPLAFALSNPSVNALPAAVLLAAFIGSGTSFLAFSILAERRGLKSDAYAHKGIYYLGGLTEATETLICFALMCVWPQSFALWAYGFAALCCITIATRIVGGYKALRV